MPLGGDHTIGALEDKPEACVLGWVQRVRDTLGGLLFGPKGRRSIAQGSSTLEPWVKWNTIDRPEGAEEILGIGQVLAIIRRPLASSCISATLSG